MEDESAQQQEVAGNPAKPAGLLYHYTDQKGLLGILENKEIWSTHLRYLNDTSEGKIVFNAVLNEINSRVDSDAMMKFFGMSPIKRTREIRCNDNEIIGQGIAMSSWVTSQSVFVTSFSEEGNLLSQWRAYSGASGGYSIGFSRSYLRSVGEHFLQDRPGRFYSDSKVLAGCKYFDKTESECLENDLEKLVTSYIIEANSTKESQPMQSIAGFITPSAIALKYFLPLGIRSAITKDDAFHEEAEWRLVFVLDKNKDQSDLKFRPGRSMPTPFFKIPLIWEGQPVQIERIIIGPCPYPDETAESVKMLLKKEEIHGVEVIDSKIPYRNG